MVRGAAVEADPFIMVDSPTGVSTARRGTHINGPGPHRLGCRRGMGSIKIRINEGPKLGVENERRKEIHDGPLAQEGHSFPMGPFFYGVREKVEQDVYNPLIEQGISHKKALQLLQREQNAGARAIVDFFTSLISNPELGALIDADLDATHSSAASQPVRARPVNMRPPTGRAHSRRGFNHDGERVCFHCGSPDHGVRDCPKFNKSWQCE